MEKVNIKDIGGKVIKDNATYLSPKIMHLVIILY